MDKIKLTAETEPKAKSLLLNFLNRICWGEYPKASIERGFFFYQMLRCLVADGYDISDSHAFEFVESVFNDYCLMCVQKSKLY